jgi:thioredoxin 2
MINNTDHTFTTCPKCSSINKVKIEKLVLSKGVCGKCSTNLNFHQLVSEVDINSLNKIILKSDLPVVVDFWAPWCGPCKQFAPTFETASNFASGKMVFLKINTEQFPHISQQFNIRGIPTLIIFKNRKEIARESGAFPLETFKNWISRFF